MPPKVSREEARQVGDELGVDFGVVPLDQWRRGLEVELEHGSEHGPLTNVTGDDLKKTGQIALAHLIE